MSAFTATLERFRDAVAGPPDEVPLGRAALLIAQGEYPDLDVERYESRIEEIAATLRERLPPSADPQAQLRTANELLFSELGFHGDDEGYEDLQNLWLNDVLDRRTGIPVTLAILHVEVCQRAGIDVRPVGLPGHVVTRLEGHDGDHLFVDVFRGGRILTAEQCKELVRQTYGPRTEFRDFFLSAITPRFTLRRLLNNVKVTALRNGGEEQAARAIDLLLAMYPWDLDELRDRGMLHERLGEYTSALADLEQYVRHRAGARDIRTVSEAVRSLRRHISADTS